MILAEWEISAVRVVAIAALGAVLAACTSIEGKRLIDQGPGKPPHVENVGGMPITLKVPNTAVFVGTRSTYSITETQFDEASGEVIAGASRTVVESSIDREAILLGPTETYAIDLKRPMFGTIDYAVDLTEQYPQKISGKLDDKTLSEVLDFAKTAIGQVVAPGSQVVKQAGVSEQRTLVSQEVFLVIFDLRTGGLQVQSF